MQLGQFVFVAPSFSTAETGTDYGAKSAAAGRVDEALDARVASSVMML